MRSLLAAGFRDRHPTWTEAEVRRAVAPPEYVVLRKLEYYREGRSTKHPADIRAIVEITGVDEPLMAPWLARMGLNALWQEVKAAP